MRRVAFTRLALVSVLGLSIICAIAGLALILDRSQARNYAELRTAAHQRAELAATLIDSVLAGPAGGAAQLEATLGRDRTAGRRALAAVFGPGGTLISSRPSLSASVLRLVAAQPAVAAALRTGHRRFSNLVVFG